MIFEAFNVGFLVAHGTRFRDRGCVTNTYGATYFRRDPWLRGKLGINFECSTSQWDSPPKSLLRSRQHPGRISQREHVPGVSICDVQSDSNRRGPSGRPGQSVPRSHRVHSRRVREPFRDKRSREHESGGGERDKESGRRLRLL